MRRPRFTIASILVLIVFAGIAFAGLRASNAAWDSGIFGITLLSLLTTILLAVHRSTQSRAYWLGFAFFGCAYLAISLIPSTENRLPTTRLLYWAGSKLITPREGVYLTEFLTNATPTGSANAVAIDFAVPVTNPNQAGSFRLWSTGTWFSGTHGTPQYFTSIGHSLFAIVLAFLGAHTSSFLYAKNRAINPPAAATNV